MKLALDDLVVVVTGAAGGIGTAVWRAFLAEGARLVLLAKSGARGLSQTLTAEGLDARALCVQADVRDAVALEQAMQTGIATFGRVDACIANAGIWPSEHLPLHAMPVERIDDVLGINLRGVMLTCRAFMQALSQCGPRSDGRGASITMIGSTAGHFGEAGHSEYAATKAALVGLMLSLKNELPRIDPWARVNLVEPGWTVTEMARGELERPGVVAGVCATMPLRQLARPEDVAASVAFLSSPRAARHLTGQTLTVAGGMEGRALWGAEDVDPAEVLARLRPERA